MASTSLEGSYDGFAPFEYTAAAKPLQTYYRVFGSLTSGITPLICIHGGPGLSHNYLLNHSILSSKEQGGRAVVFYDQIGSGLSTHLPETAATPGFWTEEIFFAQLGQLLTFLGIKEYDILGSSWGGMLASAFAATRPPGLRKLVLANSAASKAASIKNRKIYRSKLPIEMQEVLNRAEVSGDWNSEEVGVVMSEFTRRYVCGVPLPEDWLATARLSTDRTVVDAMGDEKDGNPFEATGFFETWTMEGRAFNIDVPTSVINGIDEFASGDAVKPFLDEIPNVRLVTLEGTHHSPHFEKTEGYMRIVGDFLRE